MVSKIGEQRKERWLYRLPSVDALDEASRKKTGEGGRGRGICTENTEEEEEEEERALIWKTGWRRREAGCARGAFRAKFRRLGTSFRPNSFLHPAFLNRTQFVGHTYHVNHCSRPFFVSRTHLSSTPYLFFSDPTTELPLPSGPTTMARKRSSSRRNKMPLRLLHEETCTIYIYICFLFTSIISFADTPSFRKEWGESRNSFSFYTALLNRWKRTSLVRFLSFFSFQTCSLREKDD